MGNENEKNKNPNQNPNQGNQRQDPAKPGQNPGQNPKNPNDKSGLDKDAGGAAPRRPDDK